MVEAVVGDDAFAALDQLEAECQQDTARQLPHLVNGTCIDDAEADMAMDDSDDDQATAAPAYDGEQPANTETSHGAVGTAEIAMNEQKPDVPTTQSIENGTGTTPEPSEPVAVPPPSVEELTYASAADGYYYYVHIKTSKYFALDEVGYWYYQTEAGDYAMCSGVEHTAQPIAATAAVASDDTQLVPFDGHGRPMFPKDLQGHYVLPTDIHGIQKFPLDSDGNALFPWDPEKNTWTFPIGVDGQPLFPLNSNGKPVVPVSDDGRPIYPRGPDGHTVFPVRNGRPVPAYTHQGQPVLPVDEAGKVILPYDKDGKPLIHVAADNVTPLETEQALALHQQWSFYQQQAYHAHCYEHWQAQQAAHAAWAGMSQQSANAWTMPISLPPPPDDKKTKARALIEAQMAVLKARQQQLMNGSSEQVQQVAATPSVDKLETPAAERVDTIGKPKRLTYEEQRRAAHMEHREKLLAPLRDHSFIERYHSRNRDDSSRHRQRHDRSPDHRRRRSTDRRRRSSSRNRRHRSRSLSGKGSPRRDRRSSPNAESSKVAAVRDDEKENYHKLSPTADDAPLPLRKVDSVDVAINEQTHSTTSIVHTEQASGVAAQSVEQIQPVMTTADAGADDSSPKKNKKKHKKDKKKHQENSELITKSDIVDESPYPSSMIGSMAATSVTPSEPTAVVTSKAKTVVEADESSRTQPPLSSVVVRRAHDEHRTVEFPAHIQQTTTSVPVLQYSCRPTRFDTFTTLKTQFEAKGGARWALRNINARKALVQAEETSQELVIAEAEHAKAKLESSRWRPIGAPASADASDNDDPQLAELRARAIASLEKAKRLVAESNLIEDADTQQKLHSLNARVEDVAAGRDDKLQAQIKSELPVISTQAESVPVVDATVVNETETNALVLKEKKEKRKHKKEKKKKHKHRRSASKERTADAADTTETPSTPAQLGDTADQQDRRGAGVKRLAHDSSSSDESSSETKSKKAKKDPQQVIEILKQQGLTAEELVGALQAMMQTSVDGKAAGVTESKKKRKS